MDVNHRDKLPDGDKDQHAAHDVHEETEEAARGDKEDEAEQHTPDGKQGEGPRRLAPILAEHIINKGHKTDDEEECAGKDDNPLGSLLTAGDKQNADDQEADGAENGGKKCFHIKRYLISRRISRRARHQSGR